MPENEASRAERVARGFKKTLERHGYAFQYTVMKKVEECRREWSTKWRVLVSEFPVEVQGQGTRIDIILEPTGHRLYILAECKRANPALANWCFATAPQLPNISAATKPFVEGVLLDRQPVHTTTAPLAGLGQVCHVALEVRTADSGDRAAEGRGTIERAATQVCRGLNGFIEYSRNKPEVLGRTAPAFFLPVIFTTARLWQGDVRLDSLDLNDGELELQDFGLRPVDWVYYHYPQSPGLKHAARSTAEDPDLRRILYAVYVRTIAIVRGSAIKDFLSSLYYSLV